MSININSVKLTGIITFEPEERSTPDGKLILNFSMAYDKNQFVRVSCFDKTAQFASKILKKGSGVYIEGKLFYQAWKDKAGNNKSMLSVRAFNVQSFDIVRSSPKPEAVKKDGFSYSEPDDGDNAPF